MYARRLAVSPVGRAERRTEEGRKPHTRAVGRDGSVSPSFLRSSAQNLTIVRPPLNLVLNQIDALPTSDRTYERAQLGPERDGNDVLFRCTRALSPRRGNAIAVRISCPLTISRDRDDDSTTLVFVSSAVF